MTTALTWSILSLSARRSKRIQNTIRAPLEYYRDGDFEGALTAADTIVGVGGEVEHLYIRGGILRQLGRLTEAETALVRCIELSEQSEYKVYGRSIRGGIAQMESRIRLTSDAQEALGSVYASQRRYEEALKAFDDSLRDCPGRSALHRDVAEVWMRRGNAVEALRWATLSVDVSREEAFASEEIRDMTRAENLATLAWAMAASQTGIDQIEDLIAEAAKLASQQPVTVFAQVHLNIGLAYEGLGDLERSREHLSLSSQRDVQGISGRVARETLASSTAGLRNS
jgi:tetratricopeptide (TPR) repeat protein